MLSYQFRPIDIWPGPETKDRKKSQFSASYTKTLDLLERELGHLQARNIVVQADVALQDIRNDGMLRSSARPRSPRIILSFGSKHGALSYPCDTYSDWQANLRAIGLALEALRTVDRYGVTRRAEQYRGWQALPPPPNNGDFSSRIRAMQWIVQLLKLPGLAAMGTREATEAALRQAEMKTHPDRGGNPEDFKRVQQARQVLLP